MHSHQYQKNNIMNVDYIGFVYIWTNKINNKRYIGLHVGNADDGYIGSGKLFIKDVRKYGVDNFAREILHYEYISEEALYVKEYEIITQHNAVKSRDFYNLTNYQPKSIQFLDGKKLTRVHTDESKQKLRESKLGTKHTQESKDKMSKSRIGRIVTEETRQKSSISQSGEKNHAYGKVWFNNGINQKTFIDGEQPDGWKKGRLLKDMSGSNNPFYGRKHTKETREKLSKFQKIRSLLYENNFKGKTHTEETKLKMRKPKKRK